jgi:branched-subunit amino acid aminotransferase/4-amino-4-deoxychorismate lyase
MRSVVLEAAREMGLTTEAGEISLERLRAAPEVLVSSSSQLVMPVVTLDDAPVGSGSAGPVGLELAARLRARLGVPD